MRAIAADEQRLKADEDRRDIRVKRLITASRCASHGCATVRQNPSEVPEWLEKIRARLMDEYRKRPRRAELARIAGVDPAYMSRAFRHHYGITMTEYARRQRLTQAQWLLARSNESIAEIASRCGYSDQGHLARELRRITGMTPAAWRRAAWARSIVRPSAS